MEDDLATVNIREIEEILATSEGLAKEFKGPLEEAKAAKATGDTNKAIEMTGKILIELDKRRNRT